MIPFRLKGKPSAQSSLDLERRSFLCSTSAVLAQNFIVDYFRTPNFLGTAPPAPAASTSTSMPASKEKNAFDVLASSGGTAIQRTEKQPLYLQHHGHSRTIVGIEIGKRSKVDDDDDNSNDGGAGSASQGRGRGRTVKSKIKIMASKGRRAEGEAEGEEEEEVWLLLFDPGKCVIRSSVLLFSSSSTAADWRGGACWPGGESQCPVRQLTRPVLLAGRSRKTSRRRLLCSPLRVRRNMPTTE